MDPRSPSVRTGGTPQSIPPATSKGTSASSRVWHGMVGLPVRRAVTIAASLYVCDCIVIFFLPLFRPERLRLIGAVLSLLRWPIDPVLDFLSSLFVFKSSYRGFHFLLLGMALVTWLLKMGIVRGLARLEVNFNKPLKQPASSSEPLQAKAPPVATQGARTMLLRAYALSMQQGTQTAKQRGEIVSKQLLSDTKKDLAFLSIDVVGSTQMKLGEDQIVIEHAFTEYKKLLERIFRDCRCWKVAWTPDGVMTCFPSIDDAASAGRKVLAELDGFNQGVHLLRTKFQVRCGLNAGAVVFPEKKALELVSDEVIDVAGHLQKNADPGTLWISGEVFNKLSDRSGFARNEKRVDNHDVFVWEKPA